MYDINHMGDCELVSETAKMHVKTESRTW